MKLAICITSGRFDNLNIAISSFASCISDKEINDWLIVVVDDSPEQKGRGILQFKGNEIGITPIVVNREFVSCILNTSGACNKLNESLGVVALERLGNNHWRPSRPRNWALLIARALGSDVDGVLFFDDDIVFYTKEYRGRKFAIDGRRVVRSAVELVSTENADVVGCRYCGRADMSLHDHLLFTIEQMECKCWSDISKYAVNEHDFWVMETGDSKISRTYCGPDGLSSGFLYCSPKLFTDAFFPAIYNEDWFWLLILKSRGVRLCLLPDRLGHFPAVREQFSRWRIAEEERGEVAFEGLRDFLLNPHLRGATSNGRVEHLIKLLRHRQQVTLKEYMSAHHRLKELWAECQRNDITFMERRVHTIQSILGAVHDEAQRIDVRALGEYFDKYVSGCGNWAECLSDVVANAKHAIGSLVAKAYR